MIPDEAIDAAYAELPVEALRYVNKARLRTALEAAAPHMQIEELLSGVQREIDEITTMTEVLVAHQRQNSSSCLCGWAKLGHSHPEHQAEALSAAGFGLTSNPYRSQA